MLAEVFISYSRQDRALCANFIERLHDRATRAACEVWNDAELRPGAEWDEQIRINLSNARIFFVLESPAYLASRYCMKEELPRILSTRERGAAVCVVRLETSERSIEGPSDLEVWPESGSLAGMKGSSRQLAELRTWFKVEICKALVAMHHDRFRMQLREEFLAQRDSDPLLALSDPTVDDLTVLHEIHGTRATSRRRKGSWALGGALLGALAGAGLSGFSFFRPMDTVLAPILFFAALGAVFGAGIALFRLVEVTIEDRSLPPGERLWSSLSDWLSLEPVLMIAAGVLGGIVQHVVFIGLPVGLFGWISGWWLDASPSAATVISSLLGAFSALNGAPAFGAKRLQVFRDVEHLYRPPASRPLPPLRSIAELYDLSRDSAIRSPDDDPTGASDETPQEPRESVVAPLANPTMPAVDHSDPDSERPSRARTPEEVGQHLVVVGAAARDRELSAFLAILDREGGSDLFRIEIVRDTDADAADPEFWARTLGSESSCVVLMTDELMATAVPAAVVAAVDRGEASWESPSVFPLRIDAVDAGGPLLAYQALPTGGLAVRDWPIPHNGWVNACRSLIRSKLSAFRWKLKEYLDGALFEARGSQDVEAMSDWLEVLRSDYVFDPGHELRLYPFEKTGLWWSRGRASRWALAGGAVFWLSDAILVSSLGLAPTASPVHALMAAGAPSLLFLLVAGWFCVRDLLDYAHVRLARLADSPQSVFEILLDIGDLDRGPVLRRAGRLLLGPVAVLMTWTLLSVLVPGLASDGGRLSNLRLAACGAVVGLLAYWTSRFRVARIMLPQEIPTPRSARLFRRSSTWTLGTYRQDHSKLARGQIEGRPSPEPDLIRGYREETSVSIWMVLRALLDAVWLTLVGVLAFALVGMVLSPVVGFVAAILLINVLIRLMWVRPRRYRDRPKVSRKARWKIRWLTILRPALGGAVRHYMLPILTILFLGGLFSESGEPNEIVAGAALAVVPVVTFSKRLFDLVAEKFRSHSGDG